MPFETIVLKKTKNGHQAIRIPKKLQIDDDKVYLKKVGDALYVIPYHNAWENLKKSVDMFTPDFMEYRNQPKDQEREEL